MPSKQSVTSSSLVRDAKNLFTRTTIGKYEIEGGGICPEQYDVYLDGKEIGYLRLRHGHFRAETPFGGQVVYTAEPEGDGRFEDHERDQYLAAAIKSIDDYLTKSNNKLARDAGAQNL